MKTRIEVTPETIENTFKIVGQSIAKRLNKHGNNSFASPHEILGIMDEEHYELLMAVHQNDINQVKEELIDIAVGALFGIASIIQKENEKT